MEKRKEKTAGDPIIEEKKILGEIKGYWRSFKAHTAGLDEWLIRNYPKLAWTAKFAVIAILLWTVWELTQQDYRGRAVCAMFYEKTEQIDECAYPRFYCMDGGGPRPEWADTWNTTQVKS